MKKKRRKKNDEILKISNRKIKKEKKNIYIIMKIKQ